MQLACQVKRHKSERLGLLTQCGALDASLVRVTCARAGHAEELVMCRTCMFAILYCEFCLKEDQMLVRATRLIVA